MRCMLLLAVIACGCVQPPGHDPAVQEVGQQDCYSCHKSDYESATDPVHVGHNPTTCFECHSESAWMPALEGGDHPEDKFPITNGPHDGIACTDCHDPDLGSSSQGMNVSCVGCHTGEHARARVDDQHSDVGDYSWQGDTRPAFCRDCHPRGYK